MGITTGEVGVAGLESVSEPGFDGAISLDIGDGRFFDLLLTPLYLEVFGGGDPGVCGRVNKKDLGASIIAVNAPHYGERSLEDNQAAGCMDGVYELW